MYRSIRIGLAVPYQYHVHQVVASSNSLSRRDVIKNLAPFLDRFITGPGLDINEWAND
jgi:hypothetical protein